jgi:hypothetical protein
MCSPEHILAGAPASGNQAARRIVRARRQGRLRGPEDVKITGKRREKVLAYLLLE